MDYARYAISVGRSAVAWSKGSKRFGRRFKGNGMRWRPPTTGVLRTRLALLNGDLKRYFSPPDDCQIKAA